MATQHQPRVPHPSLVDSWRSCFNANGTPKRVYKDSYRADQAAYFLELETGEPMRAYCCSQGHWHIGHRRDS